MSSEQVKIEGSTFVFLRIFALALPLTLSIADGGEIEFPPPGQPVPGFDLKRKDKN